MVEHSKNDLKPFEIVGTDKELIDKLDKLIVLLSKKYRSPNRMELLPGKYTKEEAAAYMHIGESALNKIIKAGDIQHYKYKRRILFSKAQLERFFAQHIVYTKGELKLQENKENIDEQD